MRRISRKDFEKSIETIYLNEEEQKEFGECDKMISKGFSLSNL